MRNNSSGESQESNRVAVFGDYSNGDDDYEFGPIFLPWIPRLGETIDGAWLGNEDIEYEVIRIIHCPASAQFYGPHLYLSLDEEECPSWARDQRLREDFQRALKKIDQLEKQLRRIMWTGEEAERKN